MVEGRAERDETCIEVIVDGRAEVTVHISSDRIACLQLLDLLGRIRLAARRRGAVTHLTSAPRHIRELVDLAGLDDLLR